MAAYDNLPVYKACYDLLLYVMGWSANIQRELRYTVGEDLKRSLVSITVCIYRANANTGDKRRQHIEEALDHMAEVKVYLRLLHDLRQLPLKQTAQTASLVALLERQLGGWLSYQKTGRRPAASGPDDA